MTRSEFFKAIGLTALSLGVFKLVGDRKILKERNEKTYLDIPEELRQNPYREDDALKYPPQGRILRTTYTLSKKGRRNKTTFLLDDPEIRSTLYRSGTRSITDL